jgi:hypothetical protein
MMRCLCSSITISPESALNPFVARLQNSEPSRTFAFEKLCAVIGDSCQPAEVGG